MKKTITILIAAAVALSLSSCRKIEDKPVSGNGILSFAGLDVKVDETLVTKASAASGNSMIYVKNTSGTTVFSRPRRKLPSMKTAASPFICLRSWIWTARHIPLLPLGIR